MCFDLKAVLQSVCTRSGSSGVALKTFTLNGAGLNHLEILKFFSQVFLPFCILPDRRLLVRILQLSVQGWGSLASIFTIILCLLQGGFEPGAFKIVKISLTNLMHSRRFDPVSFRVDVQDATTSYLLNQSQATCYWPDPPLSIRLLHYLSGRPKKTTTTSV